MTSEASGTAESPLESMPPPALHRSSNPSIEASLLRVRIVLVGTSHPGNVGAAARAMKVMGMARLALVAPRHANIAARAEARALASGATDVLDGATMHATLDDALSNVAWSVAMTARDREFAPPRLSLTDAAAKAAGFTAAHGPLEIAFVFGSERYGLASDDVLRCQASCAIETSGVYSSLNLAQAVQLVAYECRCAALENAAKRPNVGAASQGESFALATHEEREALIAHLEEALVAIGYLDPASPKKLMPRLRRFLARAGLEREEAQWLRGIAKAILRQARR